ncbi:hypothetical protein M434DRAFT_209576 [Hypoxylon sp. CO27-5]|nr:hypothetical protein M434DRAFT_209576 [Hypoxylon sp. CO27-5]
MASPTQDHRALLPPFIPTQPSRGHEPRNTHRIIVEPTPENQRIYNEIRQTHERLHLQTHVASQQNLLPPQSAPSVSTVYSPTYELDTPPTLDASTQDTDPPKRPRGRRRGPLEATTRLHTALKRKLRLACPRHRAKKTTCDCHDFSKLEEGYHSSPLPRPSSRGISHDQTDFPSLTPIERTLNRETFGAVGGAITPSDQEDPNELITLQPSIEDNESVRSDVRQILTRFDTDSVHLDREMLQAPGQTYHPGNDIGSPSPRSHVPDEFLEIGSQMMGLPNRWHCEYKGLPDAVSETSSEPCSWSGPFRDLSSHYRTEHHPFYDVFPCFWFVCRYCDTKVQALDDLESSSSPFRCSKERCPGSLEKRYYGSTREESVVGSAVTLTQSDESEAGYSWNLPPDRNLPWLRRAGSAGRYNQYFDAGSSNERSHYDAKWDTGSDSSGLSSDCSRCPLEYFRFSRKDCTGCHPLVPTMKTSHSIAQPIHSIHQCPVRLLPFAKLPIRHFFSIVLPLVTTIIRDGGYFINSNSLPFDIVETDAISWWSLILLLIGFMTTWALKDRAKPHAVNEPRYRARGRQRPRNQIRPNEFSVWHILDTLITT